MSMPPNASAVAATAARTSSSSRISHFNARALPPAASTSLATLWIVPGSLGLGTSDLAAIAILAPSLAARRAIARPMPREAPVMNRVLPLRLRMAVSSFWPGVGRPFRARPSRLGSLTFIVFPLQQPARYEPVDRLAGGEPGLAEPGMPLEDPALDAGQCSGAIGTLVLEQMAQVLARQQSHPARARVAAGGELEIDDGGAAVDQHQPVGLLGQVVVGEPAPVQLLQQASRMAEVSHIPSWRTLVHRRAVQVAAIEPASVPSQQLRRGI